MCTSSWGRATRCGCAARATTSRCAPAPRYRFVAGGIGITPILPMLAAAEAAGAEWTLLYGGRTRNSMAFTEELGRYGDRVHRRPAGRDRAAGPRPPCWTTCPRARSSTAAVPGRCWTRSRSGARPRRLRVERFQPKAQVGGRGHASSRWSWRRAGVPSPSPRTSPCSTPCAPPVSRCCSPAPRAPAAPARPTSSKARRTTGTRCSPTRNGRAGETMMICVSRCRGKRLVLDL